MHLTACLIFFFLFSTFDLSSTGNTRHSQSDCSRVAIGWLAAAFLRVRREQMLTGEVSHFRL